MGCNKGLLRRCNHWCRRYGSHWYYHWKRAGGASTSPTGAGMIAGAASGGFLGSVGGKIVGAVLGCPVGIGIGAYLANNEADQDNGEASLSNSSETGSTNNESGACDDELMSCEAPDAEETTSTPMPESDADLDANTPSAEELKALKERLYNEAQEF